MDLRQYFKKIRETEANLTEDFPLVASIENPDGGTSGTISEVSREIAARLIVEGRAVLADEEQKQDYSSRHAAHKRAAEKAALARRIQVAVIADSEFENSRREEENCSSPLRK